MKQNFREKEEKANCLQATSHKGAQANGMTLVEDTFCAAMRGRPKDGKYVQQLEPNFDGKTNTLTTIGKDNLVLQLNQSKESNNGTQPYQQNRVYSVEGKMPALSAQLGNRNNILEPVHLFRNTGRIRGAEKASPLQARDYKGISGNQWSNATISGGRIRRLTSIECARLQTIPDWVTWEGISETQKIKMLGNGWNIETVKHILQYLKTK